MFHVWLKKGIAKLSPQKTALENQYVEIYYLYGVFCLLIASKMRSSLVQQATMQAW